VVAEVQVRGHLEGGRADEAAVHAPRLDPVVDLSHGAAAAGLHLDSDLDRVAVRDVHRERGVLALADHEARRQCP
jgi:hypothetical protein